MGSESAGFEEAAGNVVGEVPEPESAAAEVFQPSVDGLGGTVRGAWVVEVGQHVTGSAFQGGAELAEFDQGGGNASADRVDDLLERFPALLGVRVSVGGDDVLVHAPGGLDGDVVVVGEQRFEACALAVGEECFAGVQGAPRPVQRVPGVAAVT